MHQLTRSFSPTKVTIYVGSPHTVFLLRRSALDASPLLSKMVSYHPDHGSYVMSPVLSKLDKVNFMPVGQYLERGEYDPNILDEGTEWVRLETNVSGQDAGEEVMRCAIIYDIARTLELPGLQDLAFRKLKALAKNEPHQPFAILCVVDYIFKNAQPDMKQYLVEYLAEQHWHLVRQENQKIAEVMEADEELGKRVFGLLAGLPEAEVKNEAEGKMKVEESFGEDKCEPGSPWTLVGDEAEGGLIVKGISQESTTPYPATIDTGTDRDTTAEKEKAENEEAAKDRAEKEKPAPLNIREELLTIKAFHDKTATILSRRSHKTMSLESDPAAVLSVANGTTSFAPEAPATTTGEIEEALSPFSQEMIKMATEAADAQIAEEEALQQRADIVGTSADDDRKGWESID